MRGRRAGESRRQRRASTGRAASLPPATRSLRLRTIDSITRLSHEGIGLGRLFHDYAFCVQLPKAVLFDNDGLLLDTESAWSRAEQELFRRRGREFTIDHKRSLVGSSDKTAGIKLARFLEEPGNEHSIMLELHEIVFAELDSGVDPMVGALELVSLIRDLGIPVGLVSNSPMAFILRSHEIADTGLPFDVVISAHDVQEAKPAPDPYLEALRRLGIEPAPEVVALEDSPSGVTAAVTAGLFTIGIPSVPGITLEQADLVAPTLDHPSVLLRLGIEPASGVAGR